MSDQMLFRDTIIALSSGAPPSGVAVVRMSGSQTRTVLAAMAGSVPPPRKAVLAHLKRADGSILDTGLVLFFPGPASFTGEDCGEFHVHGGRTVVAAVLEALSGFDCVRMAEAGEFTRRAFLSGKLDLAEAEALSDLIGAETEAQRRFALTNAEGRHKTLYAAWRSRLIMARAAIEARLDFADEEDVPQDIPTAAWHEVQKLREEIEAHAASYRTAEIVREGFRVAVLGAPNAGKSSLLNALAARDIAIVTEEAGTTRDVLEAALDIGGMKVVVMDTAGIRAEPGRVEAIGIARALDAARAADLTLLLEDMADPLPVAIPSEISTVRIGNKLDIAPAGGRERYSICLAAKTGEGIEELLYFLGEQAAMRVGRADVMPFRLRHVELLSYAAGHITNAIADGDLALELRAEELRLAADDLGRICGVIDTEEVLDAIFGTFCIGK